MPASPQTQLQAVDTVIIILRRFQLPTRSEAALLAEHLGATRDALAKFIANDKRDLNRRFSRGEVEALIQEERGRK